MYNNNVIYFSLLEKLYHARCDDKEEWRENLDKNYVVRGILMDLSKVFDCIPHDLLLGKLVAYSVDENFLCYIYSYLLNRKQCVRIKNISSDFKNVISGVQQGSIVGQILFNSSMTFFMLLKLLMPTILQTIVLLLPS